VTKLGGVRPISKILIANNGIGAVKAIRSIRRWAFEVLADENAVQFVVMATPEDLRANAEYIRMASEVVDVPGGSNNNNYANVSLIIDIAERRGVDAVWAGWGHASENPMLPDGLAATKRGIKFIGPSGAPMRALGDKIGSTIIAQSAGVPCIAWNGDDVRIDFDVSGGKIVTVSDADYAKATVKTAVECEEACARIGFPVMIKASEGGGGKGIRKCLAMSGVKDAFRQVQGEIPGSPIFVMRLAPKARHLEVQLLADEYGNAIALNGRDCSIQRRHQKIIEEGPPLAAPPEVWRQMEQAAVALAKAVGYANAGTVEYLFTEDGKFYFLELNPRLQVEHPVTEMITRVNLPAMQLMVAMGIPIHRIPDVRRMYGRPLNSTSTIDFEHEPRMPPNGHCIAVRITAENPDQGFQPTSGGLCELNFRSTPDVWGYFSVDSSGLVHEFADSQFGHLFASGPDREAARKSMIIALNELSIRGDIRTTVEYVEDLLRSDDFVCNRIDTAWLDARLAFEQEQRDKPKVKNEEDKPINAVAVAHAALIHAFAASKTGLLEFVDSVAKGHLPDCQGLLATDSECEFILDDIKYALSIQQSGPGTFIVYTKGERENYVEGSVRSLSDDGYLVSIDGQSRVAYTSTPPGGALRLILDRKTTLFALEYDPSTLVADTAGKLAKKLVQDGAHVEPGDAYAEIEVMKMFLPLRVGADGGGTLHWSKPEGSALEVGDVVATVALDDAACVKKATQFSGDFAREVGLKTAARRRLGSIVAMTPQLTLRAAMATLSNVLAGYAVPEDQRKNALVDFELALNDSQLPLAELDEARAVLRGRLPPQLDLLFERASKHVSEFKALAILGAIEDHETSLPEQDRIIFRNTVAQVRAIVMQYKGGLESKVIATTLELVAKFLVVENDFGTGAPFEEVVARLRRAAGKSDEMLHKLADKCRARCVGTLKVKTSNRRADLVLELLALAKKRFRCVAKTLVPALTELACLRDAKSTAVALEARRLLIEQSAPSRSECVKAVSVVLDAVKAAKKGAERDAVVSAFVSTGVPMRDVAVRFFKSPDAETRAAAVQAYVSKIYDGQVVSQFTTVDAAKAVAMWTFHSTLTTQPDFGPAPSAALRRMTSDVTLSMKSPVKSSASLFSSSSQTSLDDESAKMPRVRSSAAFAPDVSRVGVFGVYDKFADAEAALDSLIATFPTYDSAARDAVNVLHVACVEEAICADAFVERATCALRKRLATLRNKCVRRVTFITSRAPSEGASDPADADTGVPAVYTFRAKTDFAEDVLFRHIEPPHAYHLDLVRLTNFSISLADAQQTLLSNVHCYEVTPKAAAAAKSAAQKDVRFFVRMLSLSPDFSALHAERMLVESFAALELKVGDAAQRSQAAGGVFSPKNHVFLNIVSENAVVTATAVLGVVKKMVSRYADKIKRLGVQELEFKVICRLPDESIAPLRVVATNPTGFVLRLETYVETENLGKVYFAALPLDGASQLEAGSHAWDGQDVTTPYAVAAAHSHVRAVAKASSDTLFCYDYLTLFGAALKQQWEDHARVVRRAYVAPPQDVLECVELVVQKRDGTAWTAADRDVVELAEVRRPPGQNDVSMVAWKAVLKTPEYPAGRTVILIANDITKSAGSFGTREDLVFELASKLARSLGVPRLYLAANSGARIGLAESVRCKIRVAWKDDAKPDEGFDYLYLDGPDFERFSKVGAVVGQIVTDARKLPQHRRAPGSPAVYRLTDVIGEEPDLGVENLRGSGAIAGETSRAYADVFTLTLVVGRSVGIGAYLVRLGQRTIQRAAAAPIILTGFQALNKLLGREVYASNDQLGGPEIMYHNGVAHCVATDDLDVVAKALAWLAFVPARRGLPAPAYAAADGFDPADRDVAWAPRPQVPYDPRHMLTGAVSDVDGERFLPGFFDRGTFVEALGGWAKTVVVGRARLGGIPVGCIATENRTAAAETPADPADPASTELIVQQAGGVWFPDSAFKTAQALRDFSAEDLPVFIFANWRGFSGGQRDMFDEVLKYGAQIVDALVAFQQPVFVYIPPLAELRGGAWVVVDPTINADCMEMYAAETARGGVLEAAGLVEIKFRAKDLVLAMHRLDAQTMQLDSRLADAHSAADSAVEMELRTAIALREKALLPVYTQFAVHFADLHDTPGRMTATGVVRAAVPWKQSRGYFFKRLERRLAEFAMRKHLVDAEATAANCAKVSATFSATDASAVLQRAFGDDAKWADDDSAVLAWLKTDAARTVVSAFRARATARAAQSLVAGAAATMSADEKAALKAALLAALD